MLNINNKDYIDSLYQDYQRDPFSVDPEWRAFFKGFEFAPSEKINSTDQLIDAYRKYSHLGAHHNPVSDKPEKPPQLNLSHPDKALIDALDKKYLGGVGVEAYNLGNKDLEEYIHGRILSDEIAASTIEDKKCYFQRLGQAQLFEEYIHKKFTGAKRFSLEGAEVAIPLLIEMIEQAAEVDVEEAIIGMAHRGRLNVLTHLMSKPYEKIFDEFSANYFPEEGQGDVKYHKGATHQWQTRSGRSIFLKMASNPSHLESVDPVVLGMAKARQNKKSVLPIIIHGDAAISGQGVVYEMMQLYKVDGYQVGGAIQLIINNQIGYTATPEQYKSTRSCSDIAKTFGFPIFHLNGDDIESAIYIAKLAVDIRKRFAINVVINLHGFRKYGHNEADEPRFTQPLLYQRLKDVKSSYQSYGEKLKREGVIDETFISQFEERFKQTLDAAYQKSLTFPGKRKPRKVVATDKDWESIDQFPEASTELSKDQLIELGAKLTAIPTSFDPHPKLAKLFEDRKADLTTSIDWATAEYLAYGSLLQQKFNVRLSGQDSIRGTFSHRHAHLYSQKREDRFSPLEQLGSFQVYNSILSEYAVLGFEYGYSLIDPNTFVMWEGQFGDFCNGAQIIIDQFIASSQTKWRESASLTLFLPHALEGMGPEHSSCRLERFLQLAADNNLRICYPTTPSQVFHLFRRQMLVEEKAPLIIASPKSLLRLKESFSTLDDLADQGFQEFLVDPNLSAKRLVICSGKIYYELFRARAERGVKDLAIIRVEQIYPFHMEKFKKLIGSYKDLKQVLWVQEEQNNQGCWSFLKPYLKEVFKEKIPLEYVGRVRRASPAAGSLYLHNQEQEIIIREAIEREI
jgi:2-oxoglutarate dehydrogenase E1 component